MTTEFLDSLSGDPTSWVHMDDGARIAVWDSGGFGIPIVWVHGFPENRLCWRPVLASLITMTSENFRFVLYDLRGHGRSSATGEGSLARFYADHQTITTSLELGRYHLVGHDWGGAIALHVAR